METNDFIHGTLFKFRPPDLGFLEDDNRDLFYPL
jgi:hypothetical protein